MGGGKRGRAKAVLPEQLGALVPPLGVVTAGYELGVAACNTKDGEDAVINVACKATDIALRNTCQYGGAKAGAAIGLLIPIPIAGPLIGATIGGAVGRGGYLSTKYAVKNYVLPHFTSNPQILRE